MKKALLYSILFFITSDSYGQYSDDYYLNFDTGYVLSYLVFSPGITYINDSSWINIDTTNYHRNQWQIGRPQKTVFDSAYSYPNAIVTDTLHPCLPNDTSAFILKIPIMVLGGELSFEYQLNIDTGDIATIEISTDEGTNWINVLTDTTVSFDFGYMMPKPDLSVSTTGWENITIYDLNHLYSSSYFYLLRFTLITDSSAIHRDGWMIDNIYVGIEGEGVPVVSNNNSINIYPDPVTSSLSVTAENGIESIAICNLMGQTVYTHKYNTVQVQVDVSNLPAGLYFVKINDSEVRKFVKE